MMKKIILLIAVTLLMHTVKSQNIECVGKTITIPLTGYKIGSIQWQFSTNQNDWTDLSGKTTTTLQYSLTQTGYFRAKIKYGQCHYYSDTTYINVFPLPTTANAGLDINITSQDTITTLSANSPISGKGKWAIISGTGGVLINDTLPSTVFKGKPCTDYILRWTTSTGCLISTDDVNISFHAIPTIANAGLDQSLTNLDTIVTLQANTPLIGKGKWSIVSGADGTFTNDTLPNTTFIRKSGDDYVLRWTIETGCNSISDEVEIIFWGQVKDVENNYYKTIKINNQIWMAENLKTTKYNDGGIIEKITDNNVWATSTGPAFCWYDNDSIKYNNPYGALYNWYCIDSKKICPMGWHVPLVEEWNTLIEFLGGTNIAGSYLKEGGLSHWSNPNSGANNNSRFSALPGGIRHPNILYGKFGNIGIQGLFWSSTESSNYVNFLILKNNDNTAIIDYIYKGSGLSVRCIKD